MLLGTAGYLHFQNKTASFLHYLADMIARGDCGYRQDPDYRNDCGLCIHVASRARCVACALPASLCFLALQSLCVVDC